MSDLAVSAPPDSTGMGLFPRPYDQNTPLRDRVTGYVFRSLLVPMGTTEMPYYMLEAGDPAPGVIRYLPAPPVGERWIPHTWCYTPAYRFHILTGDQPASFLTDRLIGCSVRNIGDEDFPDACSSYCVWSDGCPDCVPEDWQWCPTGHCGSPHTADGRIPLSEFAEGDCACFTTCEHCGERVAYPDQVYVENEGDCDLCESCVRRHFTHCTACNNWYRDNNGHDCGGCDCGDCGDCDSQRRAGGLINYYSYKPCPEFKGDGPVYLGVEMEIDTGSRSNVHPVAEFVANKVGDTAYMKEDSSIGDGFELVTHPLDYRWALANFPWGMFANIREQWGLHNGETCGIHVHVNRDGFTDQRHTYRWLKFIYRNAPALRQLSRRQNGQLQEWGDFREDARAWAIHHAKTGSEAGSRYSWSHGGGDHPREDVWWVTPDKRNRFGSPHFTARYSAVNVGNEQTFELRFFAGSVYASQVKAAMGFAHASVEYTRTLTARDILTGAGWEWDSFVKYLTTAPDDMYTDLVSEIERLVK